MLTLYSTSERTAKSCQPSPLPPPSFSSPDMMRIIPCCERWIAESQWKERILEYH